jgi:hypothetical protein
MHASANDDKDDINTETIDIHALRISTRKYIESKEIDKIISNNSIDCSLMKNLNYFPKNIFEMGKVDILTSQGNKIKYELGDNINLEPSCGNEKDNNRDTRDKSGYRSDVYKHLLKRTKNIIREKIIKLIQDNIYYISYEDLIKGIDVDKEIIIYAINNSVRPNILIENYYIEHHNNGIKITIINDEVNKIEKIKIKIDEQDLKEDIVSNFEEKMNENIDNILKLIDINYDNIISTTISIYFNLNDKKFKFLLEYIITNYSNLKEKNILYIVKCLDSQGILIRKKDMLSYNKYNNQDYIGYINIYNVESKDREDINNLDISLYNNIEKKWVESLTITQQKEFSKNRSNDIMTIPENMELEEMPWGIIEPQYFKKENIIKNNFKIFSTDAIVGKGKKIGRVCSFYNKKEQHTFIKQLEKDKISVKNFKDIKDLLCKHIAYKLMENKKLILLPLFKPLKI